MKMNCPFWGADKSVSRGRCCYHEHFADGSLIAAGACDGPGTWWTRACKEAKEMPVEYVESREAKNVPENGEYVLDLSWDDTIVWDTSKVEQSFQAAKKPKDRSERLQLIDETIPVWRAAVAGGGEKPMWAEKHYRNGCPFCEAAGEDNCKECHLYKEYKEDESVECLPGFREWSDEHNPTPANAQVVLNNLLQLRTKWEQEDAPAPKYPDACPRSWWVTGRKQGDGKRCQRRDWNCSDGNYSICKGRRKGKEDRREAHALLGWSPEEQYYSPRDRRSSRGRREND